MVWLIVSAAAVLAVLLFLLARRQMKNPNALDGEVEAGPALVGASLVVIALVLAGLYAWLVIPH